MKTIWHNPLPLKLVATNDSMSFKDMKEGYTGIPIGNHVGAFGVKRKHHRHEGVDLYAPDGTEVYAMEDGIVTKVIPFTGEQVGFPWWENTDAVLVEGKSGVIVYGEVTPCVKDGTQVKSGDLIGFVKTVLKVDKGRPMSMLHVELHKKGTTECPEWIDKKPKSIKDPTSKLLEIIIND